APGPGPRTQNIQLGCISCGKAQGPGRQPIPEAQAEVRGISINSFPKPQPAANLRLPSPSDPPRPQQGAMSSSPTPAPDAGAAAMAVDDSSETDQLDSMSTEDIVRATRLLDNEVRVLKDELQRNNLELENVKDKIKENQEKIKLNKQLPYLVGNIVEILEMNPEDEAEEDGANIDLDSQRKGKCVVLKTSTRQTIFLPVIGLVDPDNLKPGDLVGVNKDSYLILDTLPSEYDSRVKAMEVDEKPTEDYNDIGGLEKEIQELVEAIVLPMTHKEQFQKLGIRPPKGVLLYGPPGTGKTLMARACAAQTNATFLKLAGPQLVQMFIGDGAKLVRDAFELAKEKAPCIIFIDEIDAIGTKRFDSEVSGDREVQRTMLELLNQLDGFSSDERIKVIAATNRADILDPALLRSGRLDRKIEFPHPTEEARARILQIHSRKMNVHPDVNFEELARSTDDFNGAQLKAVCVEAGMLALRRDATEVIHEDFNEGIIQVQAKKKSSLNYYA
uniref:AAA+ ATPase domain-containing protein n=1 Tax=Aegilops tauschii subsp. strangulata TaxID=200361 RepID=A0A453GAG4_AEGTS